jgi:hypothetical protein
MTQINDAKKIVLIMTMGLCDAIRSKALPIDEAEHYLFSPHTMRLMDSDVRIKNIIHLCTEFGDIARLVPHALDCAILDAKQQAEALLRDLPPCNYQDDLWLTKLLPPPCSGPRELDNPGT